MKQTLYPILAAALMATSAIHAQQPPPPQPPQAQAAPCGASTPTPKAPPRVHFKIPPRFQKALGKEEAKIEANTGISVDANQMLHDARTPAAKPCLNAPAPAPAPPTGKARNASVPASRNGACTAAGLHPAVIDKGRSFAARPLSRERTPCDRRMVAFGKFFNH